MPIDPQYRVRFDAETLNRDHRPRFVHPHKLKIFEDLCQGRAQRSGTVTVSRWEEPELPLELAPANCVVRSASGVFDYGQREEGTMHWHLNFAHSDVFAFYGGPLLAQDEHQAMEHPALGSVRQALLEAGLSVQTTEGGRATPVLVSGVEHRLVLATDPDAEAGRPQGLYGNRFSRASWEAVERAVSVLEPPTASNVLAMEAPAYGVGLYDLDEIRQVVATAYTGFRAARVESEAVRGPGTRVVIHTGFWGCGAYGGNHVLMAALQILAAHFASVDRLVFYTFDSKGENCLEQACSLLESTLAGSTNTDGVLQRIAEQGFEWGTSDGN